MAEHHIHGDHPHEHGPSCGHVAVAHDGHVDYLHDGHMHHPHDGHFDEHRIAVDERNPEGCHPHGCDSHDHAHQHGPSCGHARVPHGDHVDYLVGDHLHHPHDGHCDHHGRIDEG